MIIILILIGVVYDFGGRNVKVGEGYASAEDASHCHPERSEGSVPAGNEMLRCHSA
jgi:hypothetical protein